MSFGEKMAIQDEIPKSRLTLRYKTEVNGQPADITLPLRLMILGDFSQGSSTDRKQDLDERRVRNLNGTNLDAMMAKMNMHVDVGLDKPIPINSMKSFSPDQVAEHVPELARLLTLKRLIVEMLTNVNNDKKLSKSLNDFMKDIDEEALRKFLSDLNENFKDENFKDFNIPDQLQSISKG